MARSSPFARVAAPALFGFSLALFAPAAEAQQQSLRFFGNGAKGPELDIDRVKIRIDDPFVSNDPGPPVDVGATDFTIEFWLKPTSQNTATVPCGDGNNNNWIFGNIVIDRDRWGFGRKYGVSLSDGSIVFAVIDVNQVPRTFCTNKDLRDGQWHHVALQRRISDGFVTIYVDGTRLIAESGPQGDISYPDNAFPDDRCNGSPCLNSDPFIVIGAEKHDVGPQWPAYFGWFDELRYSNVIRYTGTSFTVPTAPFAPDANTVALYHFDGLQGLPEEIVVDSAPGGASPGVLKVGGDPVGPVPSTDTPFGGGTAAPGAIRFSSPTVSVSESAGNATISVQRVSGSSGPATVQYATSNGTAVAGSDYTAAMGTLTWADGDAAPKTFAVPLVNDAEDEPNETVILTLSNATGAALGSPATATLTIIDDDAPPSPGTVQFSAATASVAEAAGSVTIAVQRVGGSEGRATVDYSTGGGTATPGADYTTAMGTLTWETGEAGERTFSVSIVNDSVAEGDETILLSLANVTGAALGTPSSATLTIVDDDSGSGGGGSGGGGGGSTGGGGGGGGSADALLLSLLFGGAAWLRRRRMAERHR